MLSATVGRFTVLLLLPQRLLMYILAHISCALYEVCPKKPSTVNIMGTVCATLVSPGSQGEWTGICVDSDDLTVLVSGVVDTVHWACALCGRRIQNDWASRAMICIKFCIKLEHSYLDDSESFQGQCCEYSMNKSVAQTLQRWLRICWKWSIFWTCTGCNQRSVTDGVRTRGWSGIPKTVWDFDTGSWRKLCCSKIHSAAFATRSRRNIMLQLLMTWFRLLPMNQISSRQS